MRPSDVPPGHQQVAEGAVQPVRPGTLVVPRALVDLEAQLLPPQALRVEGPAPGVSDSKRSKT